MDALAAIVDAIPPVVLFVAACAGHTFLLVTSLNVLYGFPLPHGFLRVSRKIDVLLVLAGPVLFAYALGWFDGDGLSWQRGHRGWLVTPYTVFCAALGVFVVPVVLAMYYLRRAPSHVLRDHSTVVDVAAALGYTPLGHGKKRHLAKLPFNQVFQVDFAERTFSLPRLPAAWDGLSILHLSDLHLCGTPDRDFYNFVMDRCREWGVPDVLAVTGDIVDSSWHHRWIVPVLGRLTWKHGAFAILGNHDSWRDTQVIRRRLRRVGLTVLANAWEQIEVRGQRLVAIGHEGPWFTPAPELSDCPAGTFRLCLSHTPDNIQWARDNDIDLVLAGHVHGGQIRLPIIGSLFVPSRYSRRYDGGTFFEDPTLMYVSRGLGGQHPLRYNCLPEVTWIELRRG